MAGPWEKYGAQQGQVVSLPPDPMQAAAAAREEARLKLAQDAAARADAAANKPSLPVGWRMGPNGVAERIPGLPATNDAATPKISAKERADAIAGYTSAQQLRALVTDLQAKFAAGPGATRGIRSLTDYLPTTANRQFDAAGNAARGIVGTALGFTGGQLNTATEANMAVGPYLPQADDRDEVIADKIRRLSALADQAEQRSIAILGGKPDANGNVTPLANAQMGISNDGTRDTPDPETSRQIDAMIRAGKSNDEIIAFAKSKGFNQPPAPEALDAARSYLSQNPQYQGGFTQAIDRQRVPENSGLSALGIDPNSQAGAYGVAAANALTAGTLDEMAGGNAQQAKDILAQQYPGSTLAGNITGSAIGMGGLNAGLRFGGGRIAGLATRGGGIGGDMLYGGAFGAGESNDDRLMGGLTGAGAAAAGNLVGRGIVSGAGKAARGITNPAVDYLSARGVRMTPGQLLGQGGMFGRGVRAVEDTLESVPFVGAAIKSRKAEGLRDFNRETFKDALAPIGEQVQGTIGQDAIGEAQDLVSDAYGNALGGTRLRADGPFIRASDSAIQGGSAVPVVGDQFNYLAQSRLDPLFDSRLGLDGKGFQAALQTLSKAGREFPKQGIMGSEVAGHVRGLKDAFVDLANRQAPHVMPRLNSANQAYKNLSVLEDAVMSGVNADGVFTPAQLGRATINNTKKFGGKHAAARGDMPFAELQQAGQQVLPNQVPNSGTTDRALATLVLPAALGGSAYGANELNAPTPVVATLAGLGALSTRKGNDVAQSLLTSRNPQLRALGESLLRKTRLGGMFGGAAALPYAVNP